MSDKQSQTADRGRYSKLAVGREFNKQQRYGSSSKYAKQLRTLDVLTGKRTPFTQCILFKYTKMEISKTKFRQISLPNCPEEQHTQNV